MEKSESLTKKKSERKTSFRILFIVILVLSLVLGYNFYTTVNGFQRGGVKVDDDPYINEKSKTLAFWVELTNHGYFPIQLEITLNFTDLRHNKHIGTARESFDIGGKKSVNKTFVMNISEEFVEYAKNEDGLYVEILPIVKGTYVGFIPIPKKELDPHKIVIYTGQRQ